MIDRHLCDGMLIVKAEESLPSGCSNLSSSVLASQHDAGFRPFSRAGGGGGIFAQAKILDVQASRPKAVAIVSTRLLIPLPPEGCSSGGLSEAFRKRVLVQRRVFLLAFLVVFCAARAAAAEQSPPNSLAGQVVSDGKTGRVGIGTAAPAATLDVYRGEIKIGSTGADCNAALSGALRYTDGKLKLCNGTSWRNVVLDYAP